MGFDFLMINTNVVKGIKEICVYYNSSQRVSLNYSYFDY